MTTGLIAMEDELAEELVSEVASSSGSSRSAPSMSESMLDETSTPTTTTRTTLPAVGTAIVLPYRLRYDSPAARTPQQPITPVGTTPAAPVMTRAHSSPAMGPSGRLLTAGLYGRPSSPVGSYRRYHSPSRRFLDESGAGFGGQTLTGIGETVLEEEGEDGQTTGAKDFDVAVAPAVPSSYQSHSFPRRHRSSSPLHQVLHPSTFVLGQSTPPSAGSSSGFSVSRYNESYPSSSAHLNVSFSSTSSMPSTPTSARSRSPSISSLETIPDSPDAEAAELEAERIAKLKAAADEADGAMSGTSPDSRRRSYLDVPPVRGRGGGNLLPGLGSPYALRDKRKRWSVCGAERRGDLDLETIWED